MLCGPATKETVVELASRSLVSAALHTPGNPPQLPLLQHLLSADHVTQRQLVMRLTDRGYKAATVTL